MKQFILNIIKHKTEDVSECVSEFGKDLSSKVSQMTSDVYDFLTEEPETNEDCTDFDYDNIRSFIDDVSRDEIRLPRGVFMSYFNKAKEATTVNNFMDMFGVPVTTGKRQIKLSLFGRVIELARMNKRGDISEEHKKYFEDI